MTVREKTALAKSLAKPGIKAIVVKSNVVGELQIQGVGHDGKLTTVFLPSSAGAQTPREVNMLDYGPVASWRNSRSFLAAVRMGHITVTLQ
jgi:hypothetical protein